MRQHIPKQIRPFFEFFWQRIQNICQFWAWGSKVGHYKITRNLKKWTCSSVVSPFNALLECSQMTIQQKIGK